MLQQIYSGIVTLSGWLWGIPILTLLIVGGVILTFVIGGIQFTKLGFILKHTIGDLFNKEEQARKKSAGITPFQSFTAALGATVGTGNIVGVATAIAIGGPGALFWMWICGFLAMGIKFSETVLSCHYREPRKNMSGYMAGPYMYIKIGLRCIPVATFFGVLKVIAPCLISGVHGSSITSNLAKIGVTSEITCIILVIFTGMVAIGGMKWLVKITDRMVPIMCGLYIIVALIIIGLNIDKTGAVFSSIFHGAFSGWAAVGGFTGATLTATMRQGVARGVFSTDAGLGLQAMLHAQADVIDHPAQQGMWAVTETFIDTIIICTLSGLIVLYSGVWTTGGDSATMVTIAMETSFGAIGQYGCVIALVLFGASSLIAGIQALYIQTVSMFDNKILARIMQVIWILVMLGGCLSNIKSAFVFADLINAIVLFINIPALVLLSKKLKTLTKEWFGNNGDLEKINQARKAG